jgi:hypothetical protein
VEGVTRVEPITDELQNDFDSGLLRLGLRRSDVLQSVRLFLVVEGEHDRAAIEGFFGDRLASLRVAALMMRGTRNALSILDSQILIRYSDATILVVLDGNERDVVIQAWSRSTKHAANGELKKAKNSFEYALNKLNLAPAERVVRELGMGALESGLWPRLAFHWLSKPDILYYLSPDKLNASLPDWNILQPRYLDTRLWEPDGWENIKDWLRREMHVNVDTSMIRRAVRNMQSIDTDLVDLLNSIERIARTDMSPR